jgi:hypothetical protein
MSRCRKSTRRIFRFTASGSVRTTGWQMQTKFVRTIFLGKAIEREPTALHAPSETSAKFQPERYPMANVFPTGS